MLKKQVDAGRSTLDFYKDTKKRWQKQVCMKTGGKERGEGRREGRDERGGKECISGKECTKEALSTQ